MVPRPTTAQQAPPSSSVVTVTYGIGWASSECCISFALMDSTTPTLSLTTAQQFELERMSRVIDSTQDLATLRNLAKQLLQAWQGQRAATRWVMDSRTPLPVPPWDDPLE
jgi:hypothetical protein